jgi:hypothetical protein
MLSVGAVPSPSDAINAPDTGAHPVPDAQQLANVNAAVSNAVHFENIVKSQATQDLPS